MRKDDHRGICYYEVGVSLSLFVILTKNSILDLRNKSLFPNKSLCIFYVPMKHVSF